LIFLKRRHYTRAGEILKLATITYQGNSEFKELFKGVFTIIRKKKSNLLVLQKEKS